jgi:hypothetical protein
VEVGIANAGETCNQNRFSLCLLVNKNDKNNTSSAWESRSFAADKIKIRRRRKQLRELEGNLRRKE